MIFLKVTLYSVYIYGEKTLCDQGCQCLSRFCNGVGLFEMYNFAFLSWCESVRCDLEPGEFVRVSKRCTLFDPWTSTFLPQTQDGGINSVWNVSYLYAYVIGWWITERINGPRLQSSVFCSSTSSFGGVLHVEMCIIDKYDNGWVCLAHARGDHRLNNSMTIYVFLE